MTTEMKEREENPSSSTISSSSSSMTTTTTAPCPTTLRCASWMNLTRRPHCVVMDTVVVATILLLQQLLIHEDITACVNATKNPVPILSICTINFTIHYSSNSSIPPSRFNRTIMNRTNRKCGARTWRKCTFKIGASGGPPARNGR